jgi:hypothetical protein
VFWMPFGAAQDSSRLLGQRSRSRTGTNAARHRFGPARYGSEKRTVTLQRP